MPDFSYNPGIQNDAAQYTYQGMNALGLGVQSFIQNQRKHAEEVQALQAQDQKNQLILNHALSMGNSPITGQPYVTQDDLLKYSQLGLKQKTGFMEGVAANIATDTALRNQQFVNQLHNATGYNQAAEAYKNINAGTAIGYPPPAPPIRAFPIPGAPGTTAVTGVGPGGKDTVVKGEVTSDLAGQPVMVNGKEVGVFDNKGNRQYYPAQVLQTDEGPIPLDPVFSDNGTRVADKRINRKTGAVVDTSQNSNVVDLDPTGSFYFQKGVAHPLSQAAIDQMASYKAGQQAPPAAPTQSWQDWIRGANPDLTPPTTPPLAPPGATPAATPSATPGRVLSAKEQSMLDWALNQPDPQNPDVIAVKKRLGIIP